MSRPTIRGLLAFGFAAGLTAGALAQPSPVQPQPRDPNMPAPQNTLPEKIEPRTGDATGSTGTLSERLERSDGVITPPATGAGRTIVPTDPGTTPVVPPAGEPGSGRPNVQPR